MLHIQLPPELATKMQFLRLVGLDISTVVHLECFGVVGETRFYMAWWGRVVGTPLLLLGAGAVYCLWARRGQSEVRLQPAPTPPTNAAVRSRACNAQAAARAQWRSACFVVVFMVYVWPSRAEPRSYVCIPTMCQQM